MSFNQLPTNRNFLNPTNFMFVINRLPATVMFVQKVTMPGLRLEAITTPNPFNDLNFAASSVDYGELTLVFKVDEDFKNYREITAWMVGLGFPDDFTQYKRLKDNADGNAGLRSDASLIVQSSEKNPNMEIVFRDIFPTSVSDFVMESTDREGTFVTASVTFSLRDFVFQPINVPITIPDDA